MVQGACPGVFASSVSLSAKRQLVHMTMEDEDDNDNDYGDDEDRYDDGSPVL